MRTNMPFELFIYGNLKFRSGWHRVMASVSQINTCIQMERGGWIETLNEDGAFFVRIKDK